ncbi:MAG: hypothetical protein J6S04_00515 [Clostridia bacterium]|nr:hypothetical protein [Clostridia bacterium]
MEENLQNNEEGLSLIDIIRVLFSKIKLLIIVVILGGILGGAFGIWHTIDMKYYGTSIEFYVNPEKPSTIGSSSSSAANASSQYGVYGAYGRHVMDAMIKLLASESFTEKLLLEDDGLPSLEMYPEVAGEKYTAAQTAIKNADDAWANAKALDAVRAQKLNALKEEWNALNLDASIGTFSESACKKFIQNSEAIDIPDSLEVLYEDFINTDNDRIKAIETANTVQKDTDAVVEILLEDWRELPLYNHNLSKFQKAVTYSYLGEDEDIADANNLARSFIYVNISVLNEEEFAKDLFERVKRSVPAYIEQNMIVPTDYEGTSCTRITRNDDIHRTNPNFRRNQSIKYAILAAMAAGVIAAVVVIILDAQDKRLRDHEVITRKLKVPVLGIIPTIEEINQTADVKKQQNKGGK